jgi:glycine/D-amino acid oxidase-like deaminating enzyme
VAPLLTIVGQGLAGTLAALQAETRGVDFLVVDKGIRIVHPLPLLRTWANAKVGPEKFPRSVPGWTAEASPQGVRIEGGGWIDLPVLLDAARRHWLRSGRLEERIFDPSEGRGRRVLWCGGLADFTGPVWGPTQGMSNRWQGVRGDLLTVRVRGLALDYGEVGTRFLLPLGNDRYRWGATHESDVLDFGPRPEARALLERELSQRLGRPFEVVDHTWGVRPSSRTKKPIILRHPDESGWTLFNGFGGRGVALIPRNLHAIPW